MENIDYPIITLIQIGYKIDQLTKDYNKNVNNVDRELSNTELYILIELSRFEGEMDNATLLKATYFTKQMLSKYLGQLVDKGLIETFQLDNNLKKKRVRLTESGQIIAAGMIKSLVSFESHVCKNLTPEEYSRFTKYCQKAFDNSRLYKNIQCTPTGGWPPIMHYIIKMYKLSMHYVEKLDPDITMDMTQHLIVHSLYKSQKELSYKTLEKELYANQTSIVRATKKLQELNLVETYNDANDKRIKYVKPTTEGLEYIKQALEKVKANQTMAFTGITEIQKKEFARLLDEVWSKVAKYTVRK